MSAILKTEDVPGTLEWYRRIGFRLRGVFPDTGEPHVVRASPRRRDPAVPGGETPWPDPPAFTGTLSFYLESVQGLYEEIKDHTPPAWGPEDRD